MADDLGNGTGGDAGGDEILESITVSPVGKILLAVVLGAVLGVVIGIGVSALLAEEKSPAPRVPSFAHDEPTGEERDELIDAAFDERTDAALAAEAERDDEPDDESGALVGDDDALPDEG